MNVGAIVRLNKKGLGYQTRDFATHYPADRSLVVVMPDKAFPDDHTLAPVNSTFVEASVDRLLPEAKVRRFLRGLDVVFSAETLYDWRLVDWARDEGVKSVVQGNPEFYVHNKRNMPNPDLWVWPTTWLLGEVAPGPILQCPVDRVRNLAADPHADGPLRVLHVAGHAAAGDRNGTLDFVLAVPKITTDVHVTIVGQDGWLPEIRAKKNVTVTTIPTGTADRWEMYEGQHLVVLPRRYGGNSLPANEACAAGCALAMPATSPNETWPIVGLQPRPGRSHLTPHGPVRTVMTRPEVISQVIDRLNKGRERLAQHQADATAWAQAHTWDALRPLYTEAFRL